MWLVTSFSDQLSSWSWPKDLLVPILLISSMVWGRVIYFSLRVFLSFLILHLLMDFNRYLYGSPVAWGKSLMSL